MSQKQFSFKTKALNRVRGALRYPPFERVLAHLLNGSSLDSWVVKLLPNHYQFPRPSLRKVLRGGIEFSLDISDLVDWAVYFGLSEKSMDRLFGSVKLGHVIFDVGANIGATVLPLAKRAGSGGHVFAFEPDPINFQRCRANLELNSSSNVTLSSLALAQASQKFKLYNVSERNPGMNRILPDGAGSSVQIQSITLDEFVAEKKVSRIDLIKIDVEGFELNVLLGGSGSLEKFRPNLHIELSDENLKANRQSARELVLFLEARSYFLVNAETGERVSSSVEFAGKKMDLWCTKVDR